VDGVSNSGIIFITAAGILNLGDDNDTLTNNQFAVINLSGDIDGGAGVSNTIANAGTINITANTAELKNITTVTNTGTFNIDNPLTASVTTFNSDSVVNVEEKLTFSAIDNFNNNAGATLNLNADIDFGSTGTRAFTSAGDIIVTGAPRTLTNVKSFTSTGKITFTLDFTNPRTALLNFVGTTSFALTGGEIIIANAGDRGTQALAAEIYVLMAVPMPSGEVTLTTAPSVSTTTRDALGYTAAQIAVIDDPHNPGSSLIVLRQDHATAIDFTTPAGATFTVPVGQTWSISSAYTLQTGTITVKGIMNVNHNVVGGSGNSHIIIELGGVLNLPSSSTITFSGSTGSDRITNRGVINSAGGFTVRNFQTLTNEATGAVNVNAGTLTLQSAAVSNAGVLTLNGGLTTTGSFTNTGRIVTKGGQKTINAGTFSSTGGTFVFTLDFASGAKDTARLRLTGISTFTLSGGTVIITNAEDITTTDSTAVYRLIQIPIAIATVKENFVAPSIANLAALQTALGYSSAAIALEEGTGAQTFVVLQETPIFTPDPSDISTTADTITVPAGQEWNISVNTSLMGGDDEVINNGTIIITASGILALANGTDKITNNATGVINLAGDIQGGDNTDTINNVGGTINITAATADIKNIQVINNTGEFSVDNLLTFANFNNFNNNVGGTLSIDADVNFGGGALRRLTNLGTIAVSGARTLTNVKVFTNATGTFSFTLNFGSPATSLLTFAGATTINITGGTVLIPNAESIATADAGAVYNLIKINNLVVTIAGLTLDGTDAMALGYTDAEFFTMTDGSGGTIIALRENPLFTPPSSSGNTPITYTVPAGKVWNTGTFDMGGGDDIIDNFGTINITGIFQPSGGDDVFTNKAGGAVNVRNWINMGSGDNIINNQGTFTVEGGNSFINIDRLENRGTLTVSNAMSYGAANNDGIYNEASGTINLNANISFHASSSATVFDNKGAFIVGGAPKTFANVKSFTSTGTITFTLDFAAPTAARLLLTGTTSFDFDGGMVTIANAEEITSSVTAGQTYTLISIPLASVTLTNAPSVDAADAALLGFNGAVVTTMASGSSTLVILTQNPEITPSPGTNAVNNVTITSAQTWTLSTLFDFMDEADTLTNSGTITIEAAGELQGGAGGDSITNSGIISLSGDIDLGADSDTITNTGTITIAAATAGIKNVETLNNNSGGTFNVNNLLTLSGFGQITNNAGGTFTLGANIDFGSSGTRTFSNWIGSFVVTGAPRTMSNIKKFISTGDMTFTLDFGAADTARLVLTGSITVFTINGGELFIENVADITTPDATAVYHLIQVQLGLTAAKSSFGDSLSINSATAASLGFSNAHIILIEDPDDDTKSVVVLKQDPNFVPPVSTTGDNSFSVGAGVVWNLDEVYNFGEGDDSLTNEGTININTRLSFGADDDMLTNEMGATIFVSSTLEGNTGDDTFINRGTVTTDSTGGSTNIDFETVRNFGILNLDRNRMEFGDINQLINEAGGIINLNVSRIDLHDGSRTFSNAGSIVLEGRRGFEAVRTFTSSGTISLSLDFTNVGSARLYFSNDGDEFLTAFTLTGGDIIIRNAADSLVAARVYALIEVPLPLAEVSITSALTILPATATSLGYSDYQIVAIADPSNPAKTLIVLRQNPATAIAYTATLTDSAITIPVGHTWTTSNGTDTLGAGADSFTVYGTANINGAFGGGDADDSFIIERGGVINLGNFTFGGDAGADSLTNKGVLNAAGGTLGFETISNEASGIFNANSGTTDIGNAAFTNAGIFNLKNTLNIGGSFTNTGTLTLSAGQKSVTGAGSFTSSGTLSFTLDTTGSSAATANLKFAAITAFTLNGGTIIVSNAATVRSGHDPRTTFTLIEIPLLNSAAAFDADNLPTLDAETQAILRYYNPQIVAEAGSGNITYIRLKENKMTAPTFRGVADDITVPLGQTWDTEYDDPDASGGDDTITIEGALAVFSTLFLGSGNDSVIVEKGGVFALDDILDGQGGNDEFINRGRVETRYGGNNFPNFKNIETIENYGSFTVFEVRSNAADALYFQNFGTFTNMAGGNLILHDDLLFSGTGAHILDNQGRITVGAKPVRIRNIKQFSTSGLFTFALDYANPNTARLAFSGTAPTQFTIAPGGVISISNSLQRSVLNGTYTLMEIPLTLASLNFTAPRLDYDNYRVLGYSRAEIAAIPKPGVGSTTLIVLRPNTFAHPVGTTGANTFTIPAGETYMPGSTVSPLGDGADTIVNHGTYLMTSSMPMGNGEDIFTNSATGYFSLENELSGGGNDDVFHNLGIVFVLATDDNRHQVSPRFSAIETINNSGSFTINNATKIFFNVGTVNNSGTFTINADTGFRNFNANTPSIFANTGSFIVSGKREFAAKGFTSQGAKSGFTFTLDFTTNAHNTARLKLTDTSSFTLSGGTITITNSADSTTDGQVYRLISIPLAVDSASITFAPPSVADAAQVAIDLGYSNGAEIAHIAGTSSLSYIVLQNTSITAFNPPAGTSAVQSFTVPVGSTWTIGSAGYDAGAEDDVITNAGIMQVNGALNLNTDDDTINNQAGGVLNLNNAILGGGGTDKVFNRGTLATLAGSASNVNAKFSTVEEIRNSGTVNIDHQLDLEDVGTFYNEISGSGGVINLDANLNFTNSASFANAFDNEGGTLNVGEGQKTMAGVRSFASSATGTLTFTLDYASGAHNTARLKLTGTTSFTIAGGTITITNATTAARASGAAGLTYRLIEIPSTVATINFTVPTLTAAADVRTGLGYTNVAELAVAGAGGSIRYIVLREFDPTFNPTIPNSSASTTVTIPVGRIWTTPALVGWGGGDDTLNVDGTLNIHGVLSYSTGNDELNVRSTGIVNLRNRLVGSFNNDTINNAGTFNVLSRVGSTSTDIETFETFNNTGTVNLSINLELKSFGTFNNNSGGVLNLSRDIVFDTAGTRAIHNKAGASIVVIGSAQQELIRNRTFTSAGAITFTLSFANPTVPRLKLSGTNTFAINVGTTITIANAASRGSTAASTTVYRLIEIPLASGHANFSFTPPTLMDANTITTQLGYASTAEIALEDGSGVTYVVLQPTSAPVEFTPPDQTNDPEVFTVPAGQIWNISAADINFDGGIDVISNSGTININKNLRGGSGSDVFNNLAGGTINLNGGSIDGDAGTADTVNNAGTFTVSAASQFKDTEHIVNQATGIFNVDNALTITDELESFTNQAGGMLNVGADIGFGSNKARAFSNSGTLAITGAGARSFTNVISFASTSTGTMTFALNFAAPTTARLKLTGTTSFTLGGGTITITNSDGRASASAAIGLTYYLIEIPLASTNANWLFAAPTLSEAGTVATNLGYTRAAEIDLIAGTGSDSGKTFIVLKEAAVPPPPGFVPPTGDNTAETATIDSGQSWNISSAFNFMGEKDIINNSGTLTIGATLRMGGGNDEINNKAGGVMTVRHWVYGDGGTDSIDNAGTVNVNNGARLLNFATITNSGTWNQNNSAYFQDMGTFTNQASGIVNLSARIISATGSTRAFVNRGRLNVLKHTQMTALKSFDSTGGTINFVLSSSASAPLSFDTFGTDALTTFTLSGGTIIVDASAITGNNGASLTLIEIELAKASVSFTAPTISGDTALAMALGYTNIEIASIIDPDD
ncbi:MAG: hypothetical protein ACR2N8_03115, partial [Parvibaculales bacterium]